MSKYLVLYLFLYYFSFSCNTINNKEYHIESNTKDANKISHKILNYHQLTFNENGSGLITGNQVYHNHVSFESAWKKVHMRMSPIPDIPPIDFEHESVIFIDYGEHNYGGNIFTINNVYTLENIAIIDIHKPQKDNDAMMMAVMTRPFMFIKINNTNINQVQVK